jgi:hypothetical protein
MITETWQPITCFISAKSEILSDHTAPRAGAAYQPAAEQLRRELEELTRRRVRLDILQVPGPQEMPGSEGGRLLSR